MSFLLDGLREAVALLVGGDADTWHAIGLSVWTSGLAVLLASVVGAPLGTAVGLLRPPGGRLLTHLFRIGSALPTVAIGLVLYAFFSRRGPLGSLGLLYTPTAIVIGQVLLAAPILAAQTQAAGAGLDPRLLETVRTHGGGRSSAVRAALAEIRPATAAAVVAAFGRCVTELGIALLVGGSLRFETRTLPALVTFETARGELGRAIAPCAILVALACGASLLAPLLVGERRR